MGAGGMIMAWLTPGPRAVGGVVLDVHTMLLGSLCVLLGYQTVWHWAYARFFGYTSGMLPAQTLSKRLIECFYLERGLMIGMLLLAAGLGLNLWLVNQWCGNNLGPLEVPTTMRLALWGFTTMVLGVQTIFGSFFLSMLTLGAKAKQG